MLRRTILLAIVILAAFAAPCVFAGDEHVVDSVFQLSGFGKVPPCDANCVGCRDFLGRCRGGVKGRVGDSGGDGIIAGGDGMSGGPDVPAEPDMTDYGFLATNLGATPGGLSAAPGMIGDFFGTGYTMRFESAGQLPSRGGQTTPPPGSVVVDHGTTMAIAAGERRFKIADNTSPFPVDRYFFNYNHFNGALLTARGDPFNLDRAVFGLEKTFCDGLYSFECRLPFASGIDANQSVEPNSDNAATQFGNVSLAVKRLLYQGPTVSTSIGLGMVLPTAQDTSLRDPLGNMIVEVYNQAFYLQPFAGLLWTPNDCLFVQSFIQADFDTCGNQIDFLATRGIEGVIQDQALLYTDFSVGYWIYRDPCGTGCVTGVAPMMELHYTTTLEDTDRFDRSSNDSDVVTNFVNRQDVLNLTGGLRFEMWGSGYLTLAGVAPLRTGTDKIFDAEFSVQYVQLY